MSGKIIALVCPQCGNGSHDELRERAFGAEFKCSACGVCSALVMNNQLYVKQVGEHVCKDCGRVAARGVRFCQCSSSLVQKCTNCRTEFFVDDAICPQCGWKQGIVAGSDAGVTALVDRIKKGLATRELKQATTDLSSLLESCKSSASASPQVLSLVEDLLCKSFQGHLTEMHDSHSFEETLRTFVEKQIVEIQPALVGFLKKTIVASETGIRQMFTRVSADPGTMLLLYAVFNGIQGETSAPAIPILQIVALEARDVEEEILLEGGAISALARIGPSAIEALCDIARNAKIIMGEYGERGGRSYAVSALASLGPASLNKLEKLLVENRLGSGLGAAFFQIGLPSIKVLEKYTGMFQSRERKEFCLDCITSIRTKITHIERGQAK